MKRCQKCSRTFPDENQKFCTFDGGLLMADQPTFDPNRTILAGQMPSLPLAPPPAPPPPAPPKPSVPERDLSETLLAYQPGQPEIETPAERSTAGGGGQTTPYLVPPFVASPGGQTSSDPAPAPPGAGAPTSTDLTRSYSAPTSAALPSSPLSIPPPPPPPPRPPAGATPPPPPPAAGQSPTIAILPPPRPPVQTAKPTVPPVASTPQQTAGKKKSIVPLIVGILAVLFLGIVGLAVAGYIYRAEILEFLKPRIESRNRPAPTPVNEDTNANSSTNTNANSSSANSSSTANSNSETKKEPPAFVPPSDAIQFTNSKENLNGDLAEHYVGFSFYYPRTWKRDPKAGVRGAASFAKVDRQFSDPTGDFIQERARFNWYLSKGTYEADLPDFPDNAKKAGEQLAKALPNYEEVSRGETTVNVYKAYEVRFKGEFKNGTKSLPYWGRVIFVPPGTETEKAGVAIFMLATSYAPGVTSAQDVGVKDELALILDSFRFAPKP